MIPHNRISYGRKYVKDLYYGTTTVITNQNLAFIDTLTASAMVHGDRIKPNPHKYGVNYVNFLQGKNLWSSRYGTGKPSGQEQTGAIQFGSDHRLFKDTVFPDDLYNSVLSDLNDQVRGTLDLSVDLMQGGQVARMLKILPRIRNYVFKTDWRSLVNNAGSLRLEYVYGWRPLAMSLYGVLDEMTNVTINQIENVKAGKSRRFNRTFADYVTVQFYGNVPMTIYQNGRHMCEISLRFKTKDFDIARWASLNPLTWAYELTPYSFVLDWMIDVGSYLRNLETSLLYANSFVSGYQTIVTACESVGNAKGSRTSGTWPVDLYQAEGTMGGKYVNFDRSVLTRYPLPRLPTFKAELGSSRLLNLASLCAIRLKGK